MYIGSDILIQTILNTRVCIPPPTRLRPPHPQVQQQVQQAVGGAGFNSPPGAPQGFTQTFTHTAQMPPPPFHHHTQPPQPQQQPPAPTAEDAMQPPGVAGAGFRVLRGVIGAQQQAGGGGQPDTSEVEARLRQMSTFVNSPPGNTRTHTFCTLSLPLDFFLALSRCLARARGGVVGVRCYSTFTHVCVSLSLSVCICVCVWQSEVTADAEEWGWCLEWAQCLLVWT